MTSFYHSIKKFVATTPLGHHKDAPQSLCPEYDAIKVDFDHLHDSIIRIRTQLLSYKEGNTKLWMSANALAGEFALTLEDPETSHPYTTMATTLKNSHAVLPSDRERLDTMLEACLRPLSDQVERYAEMKTRMVNHDEVKAEVLYYQQKVDQLKKAKDTATKPQSASDKEKYERNIQKLTTQEQHFHALDVALVNDLKHLFAHRVAVLGPIMLAFVCAERQMVQSYQSAINEVQLVDVNEANIWLEQHEAAMEAAHAAASAAKKAANPNNATLPHGVNMGSSGTITPTRPGEPVDLLTHADLNAAKSPSTDNIHPAMSPNSATSFDHYPTAVNPSAPLVSPHPITTTNASMSATATTSPSNPGEPHPNNIDTLLPQPGAPATGPDHNSYSDPFATINAASPLRPTNPPAENPGAPHTV